MRRWQACFCKGTRIVATRLGGNRCAAGAEAEFVRHEMTTALPLDVPIKVDLAWGDNWLESA
ncbi:MAG: hypothetical protein HY718_07880 [Planctomycetes bacterium]|nr:hypothetical protein [Planctomycetota bacterium]